MKSDSKIDRIIKKLLDQTERGEAVWTADEMTAWSVKRRGSYTLNLDSSSVDLSSSRGDDQFPFIFRIFNAAGTVVWREEINSLSENARDIEELYRLARRQALRVDETLDGVLESLDKLDDGSF